MGTGLTGLCPELAHDQGELAYVQGELLCALVVLCFLLEHGFYLGCVDPLPLPKGSETCLHQVILLFAFVWLSIACWSFFLFVSFFSFLSCYFREGVVNALIKGEIEDRVWFEDRWIVASLCDE
jgi:hypothetical protein